MELWRNRYRQERFTFEGREAVLVFPEKADKLRRWMLKTEYFGAFQDFEEKLAESGFHLAYLANRNRWGTDDDLDAKKRFAKQLTENYALSSKCVLAGMSCGGLHAVKQAAKYPEMCALLYLDAPVINLLSCPFGLGAQGTDIAPETRQEALDALGLDLSGMIAYREHPLDKLPQLLKARIPLLLVWGEMDTTVPFEENGRYVLNAYSGTGIPLLCQSKPHTGHHPHGPADTEAALKFVLENTARTEKSRTAEEIKKILREQRETRPLMREEDTVKLIFQGMLGVGHLISSSEAALARLHQEVSLLEPDDSEPLSERISPQWFRLNLRPAKARGIAETAIARMLTESAKAPPLPFTRQDVYDLCLKLDSSERMKEAAEKLTDEHWLPSHSQIYREAYRPAYRVLHASFLKAVQG